MEPETVLVTDNTLVSFENVWVKIEEPEQIDVVPLILITPPYQPMEPPEPEIPEPEIPVPKKKTRKCDQCDYSTPHKHCMDRHVLIHSDNRPYKCGFCSFNTKTKTHLKRHVELKHREKVGGNTKIYACGVCDYKAFTSIHLTNHKKKHRTNRLQCDQCTYSTVFSKNLERHLQKHAKTDIFQCDKCPFQSKYQRHLFRHLTHMHRDMSKEDNTCDLCGYTNNKIWKLKNHILLSKRSKKLTCECGFETFYKCEMRKHVNGNKCENFASVLEEGVAENNVVSASKYLQQITAPIKTEKMTKDAKYSCRKCSFVTTSNSQLQIHLVETHQQGFKMKNCDFCDYTTHDTYRLNKHLRLSKSEDLKKCVQCDFSTMQKCAMRQHNRTAHFTPCDVDDQDKPYDDIDYKETKNNALKSENKTTNAVNKITAILDKKISAFSVNLPIDTKKAGLTVPRSYNEIDYGTTKQTEPPKQVITEHYVATDEVELNTIGVLNSYDKQKPFQCVLCEFKSQYKVSVQKHYVRRHTSNDIRPYKCTNCSLATKTKDKMQTHVKRSQSDTKVSCKYCPFSSYFKCALTDHVKTHYTAKCKLCEHVSKDKRRLKIHYKTNHAKTKLKCRFCNFTTAFRENLINHENIHKGVRPFRCSMCDYAAVRMPLLSNHYRTKHKCDIGGAPLKTNLPKAADVKEEASKKTESKPEQLVNNTEPSVCEEKSLDSYQWQTGYYDDVNTSSYKTYQAEQNTTSSITLEDWQGSANVPEFHMFDGDPEETPRYDDNTENSMEAENLAGYDADSKRLPQNETQIDMTKNYIVTNQIYVNSIEVYKTDDKEKSNKCALCDFKSKYRSVVQTHYLRKHTSKDFSVVKCVHCEYATKTKDKMIAHIERSKSAKERFCSKCPFSTYFQCSLTSHKKTHLTFRCRICKIVFARKEDLEQHQGEIHASFKLKCPFCDFMASLKADLIAHKKEHMKHKQFKCNLCDYAASGNSWLINHIRKKHPHALKKARDNKNGVKPEQSENNDVETNEGESGTITDLINDNFVVNKHPNANIVGVLKSGDAEKPFKCLLCEYKSQYKYAVQKHFIRLHTEDESFRCVNCPFATKTKDKISIHITRSKSEKELTCKYCEFKSNFKCAFNQHERTHYTSKCDICGYVAKNKYSLQTHISSNHSDHKYKCQFCDYTTARKPSLVDHENIHRGIKPFKCQFCDYSAVKKTLLTNHMRKQHPEGLKDYQESLKRDKRKKEKKGKVKRRAKTESSESTSCSSEDESA